MFIPRITVLGLVAGAAATAHGQPPSGDAASLGPIRCYISATEGSYLENLKAKQLCTGAVSEAPASCYAEAAYRARLTDQDAARLCQAATSTAPALCAERLDETTALGSSSQIVDYCAALRWPMFPAPTGGSPQCIEAALSRTTLSDQEAARLCSGATTAGPVACYELGNDQTTLSDDDLVDLCTPVVIAPYYSW
jgi:hypothetical protein